MLLKQPARSYKFHFFKDRFWIWAVSLPIGLICWAIPFVMLMGLRNAGGTPGWFPFFGFLFLGVPGYLLGWIFVYSLMEGIYTKVTFTDEHVSIRLPWLIFPLIPVVKGIDLRQVYRINPFARYGSRIAVFLYYRRNGKERHFYIPLFKNNPAYAKEINALQARFASGVIDQVGAQSKSQILERQFSTDSTQISTTRHASPAIWSLQRFINKVMVLAIFVISGICAWICSTIPPGGFEPATYGFTMALLLCLVSLVGELPGIGQIVIWFLGRWVITTASGHLIGISSDSVTWNLPQSFSKILASYQIKVTHGTLTDFLFWSILGYSILISLSVVLGWLGRRSRKQNAD